MMTDYWKSLTKKYCEYCKCWITENKSSLDFHERGFRHQANVRKRVHEIQKNSTIKDKEKAEYDAQIRKIEAAALNSFQGDIARNPSCSKEISNLKLNVSSSGQSDLVTNIKPGAYNRFGECVNQSEESEVLVNGKKRALETIAKSFEKKCKWREAKTADGVVYYWNKDTLETKHEAPKSGFLSLEEQNQFKTMPQSSTVQSSNDDFLSLSNQKRLYGGWKTVDKSDDMKVVDLQLPNQDITQIISDMKQDKEEEETKQKELELQTNTNVIFQEKTIENYSKQLRPTKNDSGEITFKKRSSVKRNIRSRGENDD
ncbi:WW domain binding protein 4 [Blomia tropicalis]|nr:WW domain binding protein 4 [Blomia tropicalis]